MDFLALCVELREEAGISGSGPVSTEGQTGLLLRMVFAVRDAWTRIQDHPKDWKWMWMNDGSIETIINTDEYVPTENIDKIHPKSCKIYLTATGKSDISRISFIDFDMFDRRYGAIQSQTPERPIAMAIMPNGNIKVYPKPDTAYTITFDYQKQPQILVESTDEPEMPAEFHQLIKYEAMKVYAGTDDAPELIPPADFVMASIWKSLIWKQELKLVSQMVVRPE